MIKEYSGEMINSKAIISISLMTIMVLSIIPTMSGFSGKPVKDFIFMNSDLVAEYYFNEGYGSQTRDDSGNNNDGLLFNTVWTNGKNINNAALFFNSNNWAYVSINQNVRINDIGSWPNFCIYANIKIGSSASSTLPIISKVSGSGDTTNGFNFYIDVNGHLSFVAYNNTEILTIIDEDGKDLKDDKWHFVAVTYCDGIYALYIDPTLHSNGIVETMESNISPGYNTGNLLIGRGTFRGDPYSINFYFHGTIDDVHIYELGNELPWGGYKQAYYTFDEGDAEFNDFINDRCTWNYENRGIMNRCTFTPICIKGANALYVRNLNPTDNVYAMIPDNDDSLDLSNHDFFLSFYFRKNENTGSQKETLLKKFDDLPRDNGYHIYICDNYLFVSILNDGSNYGTQIMDQISLNTWYEIQIFCKNNIFGCYMSSSGSVLFDQQWQIFKYPGPTINNLYIGNNNPAEGIREPFNGIIDDLVISGYSQDYLHLPFDKDHQVLNYPVPIVTAGINKTLPRQVGTTPFGNAMEFLTNTNIQRDDELAINLIPFTNIRDDCFSIELMIFPFSVGDCSLIKYGFWELYINDERYIYFKMKTFYDDDLVIIDIHSDEPVKDYQWTYIKVDYLFRNVRMFINNVLQNDIISIQNDYDPYYYYPASDQINNIIIGTLFNGYIDEIIYSSNSYTLSSKSHSNDPVFEMNHKDIIKPDNVIPSLLLDCDEGNGYELIDNSYLDNKAILGRYFVFRSYNDTGSKERIYLDTLRYEDGFPSWVDNTCEVTIVAGNNSGVTKKIQSKVIDNDNGTYISVNSSFNVNITDSSICYIQKNNPKWSDNGKYGKCIDFTNNNNTKKQFIMIHDDESLNLRDNDYHIDPEFTIKFWIKPNNTESGMIMSKWSSNSPPIIGDNSSIGKYWIELNQSKIIVYFGLSFWDQILEDEVYYIDMLESNTVIIPEKWYIIQISFKGHTCYIYINGKLDSTKDILNSEVYFYWPGYQKDNIYLGYHFVSVNDPSPYIGLIDQIEFYQYYIEPIIPIQIFSFENDLLGEISDTSIFYDNAQRNGPTSYPDGKFGKCIEFNSFSDHISGTTEFYSNYTVEMWIKPDNEFQKECISVYPFESPSQDTYPTIFSIENNGKLSIQYGIDNDDIVYSDNIIVYNRWNHIAYSIIHDDTNPRLNKIDIFINGRWDSTHSDIIFQYNPINTGIQENIYYIGKYPSNIWGQQYLSNYYSGFMDEVIITHGYKDFRNDMDGDGMSDSYEIARSVHSDQFNPIEHNHRIAFLIAPWFQWKEIQYVYDITYMRHYLKSNNIKDSDIIFLTNPDEYVDTNLTKRSINDFFDGEPRLDIVGYVIDALVNGGPGYTYFHDIYKPRYRDELFHTLPRLTENDTLFFELRDHGVGYKDNALPNNYDPYSINTPLNNHENDHGWRQGRCKSVNYNETSETFEGCEELDDIGEFEEKEFVIDLLRYVNKNWLQSGDQDPDLYCHLRDYGANPQTPTFIQIDLDRNDKPEELYVIREYDDAWWHDLLNLTDPQEKMNHQKTSNNYWIRLYMDGYDYDNPEESLWDAQIQIPSNLNEKEHLRLYGVDLNEDDIAIKLFEQSNGTIHPKTYYNSDYRLLLDDHIDIDEGMVMFHEIQSKDSHKDLESDNKSLDNENAYQFLSIWWDDDIRDNLTRLSTKHTIFLIDLCYSGGFIRDLQDHCSIIMTSNIQTDTSERWNVMFYSRIRGENIADSFWMGYEDRSNGIDEGRYDDLDINADGVCCLYDDPSTVYNDRNLTMDDSNQWPMGIKDNIISFNEAMLFTSAILADMNDEHNINNFLKDKEIWKHDPQMYMVGGSQKQIFI